MWRYKTLESYFFHNLYNIQIFIDINNKEKLVERTFKIRSLVHHSLPRFTLFEKHSITFALVFVFKKVTNQLTKVPRIM